jgi:hypothetical protein
VRVASQAVLSNQSRHSRSVFSCQAAACSSVMPSDLAVDLRMQHQAGADDARHRAGNRAR